MPQIKYSKKQLDAMLAEVGSELKELLKAEEAALAKADKDEPAEESEGSSGPASPPPAEESSGTPEASAPPMEGSAPPAEGSAPPMEGSAPPPEVAAAAPEGSPEHEAGEIEPAPTVEALQAEYGKLPPDQQKMHYLAAKAALMATMGAEQSAPPAPGPEASAPPMAPPAPPAGPPPMMGKAELAKVSNPIVAARMAANKAAAKAKPAPAPTPPPPAPAAKAEGKEFPGSSGNGGEMEHGTMSKSEGDLEVEALKKQLEEQGDALLKLTKVMEVQLTPIRKSVKGVSDLKFIERAGGESDKPSPAASMTKKEIQAKLSERVREGKLSKAEKALISSYSVGGVDVSKIEHLLVDAR